MPELDQSIVDKRFCTLASLEGAPVDASELTGRPHGRTPRATPQAVRDLLSASYLDLSSAAADHGFSGLFLGVSDEVWERVVSQGTPAPPELDCRMAMLMAALRIGAIGAMADGNGTTFVWEPGAESSHGISATARCLRLAVSYIPGEHQVILADAVPADARFF